MILCGSKKKLGEPVIWENSSISRKPLCPRRGATASTRKERRRRGTAAWFLKPGGGRPVAPPWTRISISPGRVEGKGWKVCPAKLSCALGPNSISHWFNLMLIHYLAIVQPFWMCPLIGLIIKEHIPLWKLLEMWTSLVFIFFRESSVSLCLWSGHRSSVKRTVY